MPTEAQLVANILRAARRLGCKAEKQHGSVFGKVGNPDIYLWIPTPYQFYAIPVVIEVKQPGAAPKRLQRVRLKEFARFKVFALSVTSVREVVELIAWLRVGR